MSGMDLTEPFAARCSVVATQSPEDARGLDENARVHKEIEYVADREETCRPSVGPSSLMVDGGQGQRLDWAVHDVVDRGDAIQQYNIEYQARDGAHEQDSKHGLWHIAFRIWYLFTKMCNLRGLTCVQHHRGVLTESTVPMVQAPLSDPARNTNPLLV